MHKRIEDSQVESALYGAVKPPFDEVIWPVYERYEVEPEDGEEFVVAPRTAESYRPLQEWKDKDGRRVGQVYVPKGPQEEARTQYAPLRTPQLLIDLADLAEMEITAAAVRVWARNYGLLGLPDHDVVDDGGISYRGYARRERVQDFADAARLVWSALRAYELAVADEPPEDMESGTFVGTMPKKAMPRWKMRFNGDQRWQFEMVARTVQMGLNEHCCYGLNINTDNRLPSGRASFGFRFKNLLGAVWLQMARLLENGGEKARFCRLPECPRLVYFEAGEPAPEETALEKHNARGRYKTRKDKVFCDGRGHKQKYNYRKKAGWSGYH